MKNTPVCGRRSGRLMSLAAGAGVALGAASASATWSIVVCDTRTGEVVVASATCLTGFDLQANTPVLILGVGGATAQSSVDSSGLNRTYIRDRLYDGVTPADILAGLATFDSSHQSRQYGIVDVAGNSVTFSGSGAGIWKGGLTGKVGDLVYAVQGNVLTGEPVVTAAVDAIVNTPGDLPAKVMAAMEAARFYGGDGRCSCNVSNPTSCGSPPPNFTKSAHIAYLLVGRAGDRDGSNGNYKSQFTLANAVTGDVTGDGRPDVVGCGSGGISVIPGVAVNGEPPRLGTPIVTSAGGTLRDVALADIDGDGTLDIVGCIQASDLVLTMHGNGNGTFAPPVTYASGDAPSDIVAGDFNGDGKPDVAVACNGTPDVVSVYLNTGSGLGARVDVPVADGSGVMREGDIDGDGDIDLVVGATTAKTVVVLKNNGAGAFSVGPTIITGLNPSYMCLGDLNSDGRLDVVVAATGDNGVRVFRQLPGGSFDAGSLYNINGLPGQPQVADITGDGRPDLVDYQRSSSRLAIFAQKADGSLDTLRSYPGGFSATRLELADLDGDGDLDAVLPISAAVCCMTNNGGGVFNAYSGLAGGDYFLDINIANQTASDPDPVIQLRTQFDQWRASLAGRADAVQTTAVLDAPVIHADGMSRSMLTIHGRDFSGAAVPLTAANVSVTHAGPSLASIGAPSTNADGSVSVELQAGGACGVDELVVTIADAARPVVVMPAPRLVLSLPSDLDFNGVVNADDQTMFLAAFIAGDIDADVDASGFVDFDDFNRFVHELENGC